MNHTHDKQHPENSRPVSASARAFLASALLATSASAPAYYHSAGNESQSAGVTSGSASGGEVTVINLTDLLTFEPATVTISVGDTVEWRNVGRYGHTVTAKPGMAAVSSNVALPRGADPFNTTMRGGGSFRRTFEIPGEYRYVCLPHEQSGMIGKIIVR